MILLLISVSTFQKTFSYIHSFIPVPCGPGVNFDLDCKSHVLALGWETSATAVGYVAVISNSSHRVSYNTTELALRISALECGVDYSLTVMSFNDTCVSQPTELPAWQSTGALWTVSPTNVLIYSFLKCAKLTSLPQHRACPQMWW